MKFKLSIIKLVSILMLFVLTQKIAGGLYLHNWLHSSKNSAAFVHGSKVVSQYTCSCIDDFYFPFTETVKIYIAPPLFFSPEYIVKDEWKFLICSEKFISPRAPPAA